MTEEQIREDSFNRINNYDIELNNGLIELENRHNKERADYLVNMSNKSKAFRLSEKERVQESINNLNKSNSNQINNANVITADDLRQQMNEFKEQIFKLGSQVSNLTNQNSLLIAENRKLTEQLNKSVVNNNTATQMEQMFSTSNVENIDKSSTK